MKEHFLIALESAAIITAFLLTIIFLVWTLYLTSPTPPADGSQSYHQEWKYPD
jgi:hypothetical protein